MSDVSSRLPARPSLEQLKKLAKDLLRAHRAGDSVAAERFRVASPQFASPANSGSIKLADAQFVVAREHGFESWPRLVRHLSASGATIVRSPHYVIDVPQQRLRVRPPLSDAGWDLIVGVIKEFRLTGLDSGGQMTDRALARLADLDFVTRLELGGSNQLTDAGLQSLARMPQLEELDLSGRESPITDSGLEVLRHLRRLKRFQMCWPQQVSDSGAKNLAFCGDLESVDLLGTPTGDGAIEALRGKARLHRFKSGKNVTDAGLTRLHEFPLFKTWQGGEPTYALMSPDAGPTHLLLDGPITSKGLARLAGLDGLFGLSLFWHTSALEPAGLKALTSLANLGFLGCDGKICNDVAMRHIASLPGLRMLMAQGTVASDEGFEALSRSRTIEFIWGRECPNLSDRGFTALASMPALRGLAVSCKSVTDRALSALPGFPALRELMPMDVSDDGFLHVGRCEQLEALWCMYCRNTGDAATSHLRGLSKLKTYYAGASQITDRSLEILSQIMSLEKIEFWQCAGITNAGIALLASLPLLRELGIGGSPNVTEAATALFPTSVLVKD